MFLSLFGMRERKKPEPKSNVNTKGKVKKPPRTLVKPSCTAPITSCNRPVGGETGRSESNKVNSMVYDWNDEGTDYGSDSWVYKTYWSGVNPDKLIFVWLDNPYTSPDDLGFQGTINNGDETTLEYLQENSLPILVIPKYKFNDNTKRDTLGVLQNGTKHKIKWAPRSDAIQEGETPFWYYIEEYQGGGVPMKKKWGVIRALPEEITQDVIYSNGVTSFGKKRVKSPSLVQIRKDLAFLKK